MLKGVCVGAGYFSRFQYEAWNRIEGVKIIALCDYDETKGKVMADEFGIAKVYLSVADMLEIEQPDFIDIITPPESHLSCCREAYKRKLNVIVQKPLAPTYQESKQIVEGATAAGVRLMVHENFRFQPWYREIKKMLGTGILGDSIFSAHFRMRMGDGWGENAYLNRQPYFREMPRLLVYETGIHFIDTFRYLFGEVESVYATMRKLNPAIRGEDSGIIHFEFVSGTQAIWDGNRYNESNATSARYTFGEMLIEGNKGSIRLYNDGKITIQLLGTPETIHAYHHQDKNFASDCVYATQNHFVDCISNNKPFETSGEDYLENILIQEAVYKSAKNKTVINRQEYSGLE